MYTLEDVYKTFPSGCTEDYKILRAFEMGKQAREKRIAELERKLKIETELSNRLGLAYREYEQLTKEQDEHLAELEAQIEKMKAELHHRLVNPSHDDSDCLDKIIGLDRLWQFGQEF